MSAVNSAHRLWFYGVLLLLLGLVTGGFIPAFANPRMGLSAHLTAVECSLVLIVFGFLWPKLSLGPGPAGGDKRPSHLVTAAGQHRARAKTQGEQDQ